MLHPPCIQLPSNIWYYAPTSANTLTAKSSTDYYPTILLISFHLLSKQNIACQGARKVLVQFNNPFFGLRIQDTTHQAYTAPHIQSMPQDTAHLAGVPKFPCSFRIERPYSFFSFCSFTRLEFIVLSKKKDQSSLHVCTPAKNLEGLPLTLYFIVTFQLLLLSQGQVQEPGLMTFPFTPQDVQFSKQTFDVGTNCLSFLFGYCLGTS